MAGVEQARPGVAEPAETAAEPAEPAEAAAAAAETEAVAAAPTRAGPAAEGEPAEKAGAEAKVFTYGERRSLPSSAPLMSHFSPRSEKV